MEQNSNMTEGYMLNQRIRLYDDYFVINTKKSNYMFAYSEIKSIDKQITTLNGGLFIEYMFHFVPVGTYRARCSFCFSLGSVLPKDIEVFESIREFILEKKVRIYENSALLTYPIEVQKNRDQYIAKKPFGTNAWGVIRTKHPDLWVFLMAIPIFNVIPIIWYNICKKYIYY